MTSKFLTDVDAGTQDATDSVEKTDADVDPDSSNRCPPDSSNRCPPDSNCHHRQAKKLGKNPLRKTQERKAAGRLESGEWS